MRLSCEEVRDLAASFVLGALDTATAQAVRDHLATCSDAHDELAGFGGTVPYLLDAPEPVAPRPELKARVLASFAAATGVEAGSHAAGAADGGSSIRRLRPAGSEPVENLARDDRDDRVRDERARDDTAADGGRLVPLGRRRGGLRYALAAAAVLAIVGLAIGNLLLQSQISSARAYAEQLNRALSLAVETPGAKVAVMGPATAGQGTNAGGIAVLPPTGTGVLVMHDLSPTSGGQVYEAWLVVGGDAVPAGSFTVGADGYGYLEGIDVAAATAAPSLVVGLTREPGPNPTKPTLPMVAAGNAAAVSRQ